MRFLIFSAQYLPRVGGVENFTLNLSKQLVNKNHEVTIVTSNMGALPFHEEKSEGKIFRFECYNLLNGKYPILKKNVIYHKIMDLLDKEIYDFCIVNTRFYIHSIEGMKYAYHRNIPLITIDHGTAHLTVNNKILDFFGNMYEHIISIYGKRFCKEYYGVSKESAKWLLHFNIQAKGVIYNAIDMDRIERLKKNSSGYFKEQFHLSKETYLIVYTGRLVKEKGLLQLLEAVKKLNRKYSNVCLMMAGEGSLEEEIKNKKDSNVMLLGKLKFEEIISLLKEADVFCLPSDSEGFSTSLLEAAACKAYIVVTNRGGAKEVLLDETFGEVIEENNVESICNALEKAYLMDEKERMISVEKTYKNVLENYTWEITADKVIAIATEKMGR